MFALWHAPRLSVVWDRYVSWLYTPNQAGAMPMASICDVVKPKRHPTPDRQHDPATPPGFQA